MEKAKNYGFKITLKPLNLKFAEITSNLSLITIDLTLPKFLVMWEYTRVGLFDLNFQLTFKKWLNEKIYFLKTGSFYTIVSLTIGNEISIVLSGDFQLIFNRTNENTKNHSFEVYFESNAMSDRFTGNLSVNNVYGIPKQIKVMTTKNEEQNFEFSSYYNYERITSYLNMTSPKIYSSFILDFEQNNWKWGLFSDKVKNKFHSKLFENKFEAQSSLELFLNRSGFTDSYKYNFDFESEILRNFSLFLNITQPNLNSCFVINTEPKVLKWEIHSEKFQHDFDIKHLGNKLSAQSMLDIVHNQNGINKSYGYYLNSNNIPFLGTNELIKRMFFCSNTINYLYLYLLVIYFRLVLCNRHKYD
jgi:hypothetical protein